jgi:hypothetical protein
MNEMRGMPEGIIAGDGEGFTRGYSSQSIKFRCVDRKVVDDGDRRKKRVEINHVMDPINVF